MIRKDKGHAESIHVVDYCVIDLETTGVSIKSDKIIEIAAIKVRNNQIINTFSTLVNPHCHIPEDATAKNNITDDMVENSPVIAEVIDDFIEFVGRDVLIGYNIAGFDLNIIYDVVMNLRGKAFSNNYNDLFSSARKCLSNLDNYKLETVSKYYSLDTIGEHRALKDCYLTKTVYDRLYDEYGDDIFTQGSNRVIRMHYTAETLLLQELQSLLKDIIEDGKVTIQEFKVLRRWMEYHRDLEGHYPFDCIFNALDKVLEDGIVTAEELNELEIIFEEFVDPVKTKKCKKAIESITGKHIVITGDFDYGKREEVYSLIEAAGGINDKGVKRATDYVVVGSQGSESWKAGNYGGKIQKAMELKDKGHNIEIIEESDFIPILKMILKKGE